MKRYLLPPEGNLYKANLHCHSTVSDGTSPPRKSRIFTKAEGITLWPSPIIKYAFHIRN